MSLGIPSRFALWLKPFLKAFFDKTFLKSFHTLMLYYQKDIKKISVLIALLIK